MNRIKDLIARFRFFMFKAIFGIDLYLLTKATTDIYLSTRKFAEASLMDIEALCKQINKMTDSIEAQGQLLQIQQEILANHQQTLANIVDHLNPEKQEALPKLDTKLN